MQAFWIIDQLIQQGVELFCIAPGSRCTPLVLAAADHPKAKTLVHYDERGLGFLGLGAAAGSKKPAAIIVTSGTAVGNLLPAVMEAHHSCIPLILLTADRPAELRDCGANQATDQVKIFHPFVRWQTDLPPTLDENYFRSIAAQAVFHASQNPAGPVQINCQFREPYNFNQTGPFGNPIPLSYSKQVPSPRKAPCSRGVILIGRGVDPRPILEMGRRLKWPIFADILSQARIFPTDEQIRNFDWILKRGVDLKPDLILHFGERLTSKKLLDWITQPCLHIGSRPHLIDPPRLITERIQADEDEFCRNFEAGTDPQWLSSWQELDQEFHAIIESHFQQDLPFTEAHAMRILSETLPPDAAAYFGSGMPIRDADHFFFPKRCRSFFCNRGLSGIDGNIATAVGLSFGLKTPLLAFIGDQTALHDLNSLSLLKQTQFPVYLVISNNFGSGMFSHLPISQSPHVEKYFANAHAYQFEKAAEMFGIPYTQTLDRIFSTNTSTLIEIHTCRKENYRCQKDLLSSFSMAF